MVNLPPVLWLTISPTFSMPALNARFLPQVEWFHSTFGPSTVWALAESGAATAIAAVSAESAPNPHSVPPYDALLPALSWFARRSVANRGRKHNRVTCRASEPWFDWLMGLEA